MSSMKFAVCSVFGMVFAAVSGLFGGWSADMTTLICCMSADFVMGLVLAFVFKRSPKTDSGAADSRSCFKGLCKKCTILLFVLIAHRLDVSLGTAYIKTAAVIGFITNELISIIENAGLMGIPLPEPLNRAVEILKGRGYNA